MLNQQIRNINEDLHYLLEVNQQIHGLVEHQQDEVDRIENNIESTSENVQRGTDVLMSIRKSPLRYALMGGLSFAAVGTPAIMLAAMSLKAAVVGGMALGVVGGVGGSKYAKSANEKMDGEVINEKEQRLLRNEEERRSECFDSSKRNRGWRPNRNSENDSDDDDDIDPWSPRQ